MKGGNARMDPAAAIGPAAESIHEPLPGSCVSYFVKPPEPIGWHNTTT